MGKKVNVKGIKVDGIKKICIIIFTIKKAAFALAYKRLKVVWMKKKLSNDSWLAADVRTGKIDDA